MKFETFTKVKIKTLVLLTTAITTTIYYYYYYFIFITVNIISKLFCNIYY